MDLKQMMREDGKRNIINRQPLADSDNPERNMFLKIQNEILLDRAIKLLEFMLERMEEDEELSKKIEELKVKVGDSDNKIKVLKEKFLTRTGMTIEAWGKKNETR